MAVEGWPGLHGSHAHGRGTWNFKKGLGWILDCHACIGFYGYLAKACCWRNESGRLQHFEHLGHVGAGVGLPGKKTQSARWKSESITRLRIICCIAPGSKLGSGWVLNQWGCWPWAQILHPSKVFAHGELYFIGVTCKVETSRSNLTAWTSRVTAGYFLPCKGSSSSTE